jgi:hypothetical protein
MKPVTQFEEVTKLGLKIKRSKLIRECHLQQISYQVEVCGTNSRNGELKVDATPLKVHQAADQ